LPSDLVGERDSEPSFVPHEERTKVRPAASPPEPPPDPEVVPEVTGQRTRRRYSRDYKRRILAEADRCTKPGELGALLRREGLYASTLRDFRLQRERGQLDPVSVARQTELKAQLKAERTHERHRLAALERENQQLKRKLHQAEIVIDVQKKLSELLGIPLPTPPEEIP
jgi:transposase-like protein